MSRDASRRDLPGSGGRAEVGQEAYYTVLHGQAGGPEEPERASAPVPAERPPESVVLARPGRGRPDGASAEAPGQPQVLSARAVWQLLELTRGNPDGAAEIVDLFRQDGARLVGEMRRAVAAGDMGGVNRLCHELLGSSGTLGAPRVTAQTRALKEAAKAGDAAETARILVDVERAIGETARAFEAALGA